MSSTGKIIFALALCAAATAFGICGFVLIEGYTMAEAFYMSVITLSTVGFGELRPLSDTGRMFTTFFIILGFGSLAFATHALVESLFEKVSTGRSEIKRMKKQISHLKSHYIICGFGRVGAAAAEHFRDAGHPFVIVEANPKQIQGIGGKGLHIVEGDATREKVLMETGIKSARGLLALLNSDPDNLFIVLTARELNPTLHIIARIEEASSEKKIFRAGADSTISPFATAGKQIARDILAATGRQVQPDEHSTPTRAVSQWITVEDGSSMLGETVNAIAVQMGKDIIGLRRNGGDTIFPDPDTRVEVDDMLLVIDENQDNNDQPPSSKPEPQKIVVVDDNPVILRLYNRLFQKAGFYPLTASDGREGLDIIIREKPPVAVIDFMLPVLSGIEICRRVRNTEGCKDIKLILFTSDDQPETSKRALDAGADAVVVKSPEASEVIETVVKVLRGPKDSDRPVIKDAFARKLPQVYTLESY